MPVDGRRAALGRKQPLSEGKWRTFMLLLRLLLFAEASKAPPCFHE